jgi:hypothetical protein
MVTTKISCVQNGAKWWQENVVPRQQDPVGSGDNNSDLEPPDGGAAWGSGRDGGRGFG